MNIPLKHKSLPNLKKYTGYLKPCVPGVDPLIKDLIAFADASELSYSQILRLAGINNQAINCWKSGNGPSLFHANIVAEVLGYRLKWEKI